MTEFSNFGKHCSDPYCRQLDFLPFTCDLCKRVFCAEHHKYADHNCPLADTKDKRVIVCPICNTALPLPEGTSLSSPDSQTIISRLWERHAASGQCNPDKNKKPVCPVKGCREQLTYSNKYSCKVCGQTVCLKHRYETDHGCQGTARAQREQAVLNRQQQSRGGVFGAIRNGISRTFGGSRK